MIFFEVQKCLTGRNIIYLFFSFVAGALSIAFKKALPKPSSEKCIPIFFFPKRFVVLFLKFSSMAHLKVNFMPDVRKDPASSFYMWIRSCPSITS